MSSTSVDHDEVRRGAAATDARIDTSVGHGGMPLGTALTPLQKSRGQGDPDGSGTARTR